MLNKLFNLFGYRVIVVPVQTAQQIHEVAKHWSEVVKFDSENDQAVFDKVTCIFS